MIKLLNHCVILFDFRKEKTENFSYQFRAISSFVINLLNTRDRKSPIYFYCGPWLEIEWVTKPGKSSVVFGESWCARSVLGSQVFGQARWWAVEEVILKMVELTQRGSVTNGANN